MVVRVVHQHLGYVLPVYQSRILPYPNSVSSVCFMSANQIPVEYAFRLGSFVLSRVLIKR